MTETVSPLAAGQIPKKGWFQKHPYLFVFCVGLGISFLMFLPALIAGKGLFTFFGDYVAQQIPFYKHCHQMVQSGNFYWDWGTDLGSNFIGSYAFYLLGSPFFWITLPFPNAWVPYLMAPLFFLKFATAAVTSYMYISRFTKSKEYALVGALLYAFSGFQIYNIFFNHFHDVVAFFPLLLVGLEEYVQNNRKGVFALAVALCATCNYFFFVGQVVFLFLYYFVRTAHCAGFRLSLAKFLGLAFESIVGVLISGLILLPAVLVVLDNPRVAGGLVGYDNLVYSVGQRYGAILTALLFPAELPSRPTFFQEAEVKWTSMAAWLPLFSLSGVSAYFMAKRKTWLKSLLIICGLMAVVPVLNSAFFAFNGSFYARWYYMPLLLMSLMTVLALEDRTVDFAKGLRLTGFVTLGLVVAIGFIPKRADFSLEGLSLKDALSTLFFSGGMYGDAKRFWLWSAIALGSLAICWLLIKKFRQEAAFVRLVALSVATVCVISGCTYIMMGRACDTKHDWLREDVVNSRPQLPTNPEDGFYRVDFEDENDNLGMSWNYPQLTTFHSVVPRSIMDFYPVIGVKRSVASRPENNLYGVRGLASVKYYFVRSGTVTPNKVLPGFVYKYETNGVKVLENEHFVPMGFCYDMQITRKALNKYATNERDKVMLQAICLSASDSKKYAHLLPQMTEHYVNREENYFKNCDARAAQSCDSFTYSTKGFTATITPQKDNLVFFSVPYEKGWSAKVNGKAATIVQANVGFMAVEVQGGVKNTIEFVYQTPGLTAGAWISLAGVLLLVGYLLVHQYVVAKKGQKALIGFQKAAPCRACAFCDGCNQKEDVKYIPAPPKVKQTAASEEEAFSDEELESLARLQEALGDAQIQPTREEE